MKKIIICMFWLFTLGLFWGAQIASAADNLRSGALEEKDTARSTLTIASRVYSVTNATKITNQEGEPIAFEQIIVDRPLFAEFVAAGDVLRRVQIRNFEE